MTYLQPLVVFSRPTFQSHHPTKATTNVTLALCSTSSHNQDMSLLAQDLMQQLNKEPRSTCSKSVALTNRAPADKVSACILLWFWPVGLRQPSSIDCASRTNQANGTFNHSIAPGNSSKANHNRSYMALSARNGCCLQSQPSMHQEGASECSSTRASRSPMMEGQYAELPQQQQHSSQPQPLTQKPLTTANMSQ